ncbi:tripartite tricarboxylate transporter TctB family protein [uncultured Oscillibacter sp.]|uniref:tripartite tricarboxylate transporter TctB family protein n=1 Tax=uncultured Oscillibacter sp. TaxID=876091 RepID=UPI0028045C28|nr:tripartite tricarboxylate transporter TctB family protein [uncultured Oscillibacter sp.]
MSSKARESVITSVVLLAVFGFAYAQTLGMPATPALFPRMCLMLLTVLTLIMLYLDVRKYAKDASAQGGVHFREISIPLLEFIAVAAYAALFDRFGYFPATVLMLAGFMAALKVKPWWLIPAITAGYVLFIYLMFAVWLKVSIL